VGFVSLLGAYGAKLRASRDLLEVALRFPALYIDNGRWWLELGDNELMDVMSTDLAGVF
jgi:hypothetical protein